jgi:hypothetical protein
VECRAACVVVEAQARQQQPPADATVDNHSDATPAVEAAHYFDYRKWRTIGSRRRISAASVQVRYQLVLRVGFLQRLGGQRSDTFQALRD